MRKSNYLTSTNPRVPDAIAPFHHSVAIQVRFSDADMLGHVNNNSILAFMDLGTIEYFREVMGPDFRFDDLLLAVVNINADFYSQSFLGEPLEVWTSVTAMGPKSITLEQRLINPATSDTKSIGRFVMACFRKSTGRSDQLDPTWVEGIEEFEQRHFTPHH